MVLLLAFAASSSALTPPQAIQSFERLSFQIDREREGLLRRVRQQVVGGDALDLLKPSAYALSQGAAVAITGANDGIGLAAAEFLAKAGYSPILCCRTQSKADEAANKIRKSVGLACKVGSVELNLASMQNVKSASESIRAAAKDLDAPLRGLLLNAGVWPQEKRLTDDGLEEGMQVCHVGHFALTKALLPDLCAPGEEARVVAVSSSAHALAPGVDMSDVNWESRVWNAAEAYGESKLANLLFAQELAQRVPLTADQRLTSLAVHPGVVATSLFREFTPSGVLATDELPSLPPLGQEAFNALTDTPAAKVLFKKPDNGCRTSCYALLAPGLPTGAYLSDCELTDVAPAAKDPAARAALWEWTESWLAKNAERLKLLEDPVAAGVCDDEECGLPSD